jgi:hypothetical protein
VYKTNPNTLEELRNNTCCKILAISGEELQRVNDNVFCRYTVHSVRRATFSASAVALVRFYYSF